ncbi:protein translocase subunit SecD [Candidatus Saccharibacteria bacterium]|nr:protein translocase subunit SecD [Candidatus Saccharibacteria bacterium]MCB9835000.1 protein translocase subunit SecD [Candidatus Nomurabacteria bacterium]
MKLRRNLYLILALVIALVVIVLPREDLILSKIPGVDDGQLKVRQGLDLQGGLYLTYKADLADVADEDKKAAIDGVIDVINRRINPTGTSEVIVQTSGADQIVVQLPGVQNEEEAVGIIGQTAELVFYEETSSVDLTSLSEEELQDPANLTPQRIETGLTGKDLANARVGINPNGGQGGGIVVEFTMKNDAVDTFRELTTRINRNGTRLAITLDNRTLFNGQVSSPITNGSGVMTGFADAKDAQETALLLRAGSLPVPIELVAQRSIGASLGSVSIAKSLMAGVIGLIGLAIFMIGYYRLSGVVAVTALIIYTLLNIAIFKISSQTGFPIVMTLAGIAAFILSIGMAVDANILIFERMKEEYQEGEDLEDSLKAGFKRAWSSIRDSNISSLITCFILYQFGTTVIKGFALVLAIGILTSMFTAITISRNLMMALVKSRIAKPSRLGFWKEKK